MLARTEIKGKKVSTQVRLAAEKKVGRD